MTVIRDLVRTIFRFLVVWVVDMASLLFTAVLFPGIGFYGDPNVLVVAASAAFLLGIVNLLIRPVILLLALPFGLVAIFLVGFVLNAIALSITARIVPDLRVDGPLDAFLGSIVLAVVNTILTGVIAMDDDDSFYQNLAERLARREPFFAAEATQGLIMMEIDGLSYHHVKRAIADGWMPTLAQMMRNEEYQLSRFDCGLPSQTSACQAGIMFGDNHDIPAFRWYDKDLGQLIVSSRDAALINSRLKHGQGLMREGSSVNNMMNGDARVSILTLADLRGASPDQERRRAEDIYLVMLNPYFFLRTLVLYFGDVLREITEGILQQVRRKGPRLNRLAHFYPFVRAATTVLMRDVSAYLTILDIVRGTPALYVTWPGYDEVAHHSGPWTRDAFRTLRQYDKVIHRIRDTIERKAPRPYELVILSDHGQSTGWTFKQRYGVTLREFIQSKLPQGMSVSQTTGGDDGMLSVSAMACELENLQKQGKGGRIGKRVMRGAWRAAERGMRANDAWGPAPPPAPPTATPRAAEEPGPPTDDSSSPPAPATGVTVCGSGNLAQVYFDLAPRRLTLEELNGAYPGMVDALVQHPGIGLVMAYTTPEEAVVFGKNGAHNVMTGAVVGQDPLAPYGDPALRAAQLGRLAAFPHNGDLALISTLYPDGSVAAMEELVGNHGGLGGEQTDAFLFHPGDFEVKPTSNSAEVFAMLDVRRGRPAVQQVATPTPRTLDPWQLPVLGRGIARVSKWLPLAVRSILLDRWAYRQAAFDPFMTAPALLLALAATLVASALVRAAFDPFDWVTRFGAWILEVLAVYGAARLLRGRADFTTTLRAVGFAQSAAFIQIASIVPPLATIASVGAALVTILATWLAANEAHKLRGARTLLLPVVAVLVAVLAIYLGSILLLGAELSVTTLARALGLLR